MQEVIVICYLYNRNGMATWNWEAAHALREAGENVILICSEEYEFTTNPEVEVFHFTSSNQTPKSKFKRVIHSLMATSNSFLPDLHRSLSEMNYKPNAYFLNQTNLQNSDVEVPQFVKAGAFPTSFMGYLSKILYFSGNFFKNPKKFTITTIDIISWYFYDWKAYKNADYVMAHTDKIKNSLSKHGVKVKTIPPGIETNKKEPYFNSTGSINVLIVALNLEEPRKRIKWLIKNLYNAGLDHLNLTLIGNCSNSFIDWTKSKLPNAHFTGLLARKKVLEKMSEHSIFLFGSLSDDWGYVQIEAMSRGMVIVAPNQYPFEEIINESGILFKKNDRVDFQNKTKELLNNPDKVEKLRYSSWKRANEKFSRETFGNNLINILTETQ